MRTYYWLETKGICSPELIYTYELEEYGSEDLDLRNYRSISEIPRSMNPKFGTYAQLTCKETSNSMVLSGKTLYELRVRSKTVNAATPKTPGWRLWAKIPAVIPRFNNGDPKSDHETAASSFGDLQSMIRDQHPRTEIRISSFRDLRDATRVSVCRYKRMFAIGEVRNCSARSERRIPVSMDFQVSGLAIMDIAYLWSLGWDSCSLDPWSLTSSLGPRMACCPFYYCLCQNARFREDERRSVINFELRAGPDEDSRVRFLNTN